MTGTIDIVSKGSEEVFSGAYPLLPVAHLCWRLRVDAGDWKCQFDSGTRVLVANDVAAYFTKLGSTINGLFNCSGRAFPGVSAQGIDVEIVFHGQTGLVDGTSKSFRPWLSLDHT